MDSVIIAAGLGSRLRSVSDSKPLTKVCGLSLLEIAVRQLAQAGVRRVVVVTGYKAAEVEAVLPEIGRGAGLTMEAARVDDWTLPNGMSVIAGAARINGNYLLVMADHLISSAILRNLVAADAPDRGVTLAIDRRLESPLIDPEDATYVRTDGDGRITRIGKRIAGADAVDCGAFLATPELAEGIAAAIAEGRPGSLSDGMQWLADRGRAATLDIGQEWWIDVDDPAMHALAEEALPRRMPHVLASV